MRAVAPTRPSAVAVALGLALVLLPLPSALADVGVSSSLTMPEATVVGQDVTGSFTVVNTNNGVHAGESDVLTQLRVVPSCGGPGTAANPCAVPDPGVFTVVSGTGAVGTACAGVQFTAGAPDAGGAVVLTPPAPVVLGPPGGSPGADRCTIHFTLRARRVPGVDSNLALAGQQTRVGVRAQLASQSDLTVATFSSVQVTVAKATPAIATSASPSVVVGATISDSAAVTAVPATSVTAPTGTVQFRVFGPDDATCTRPPAGQSTNPVRVPVPTSPRTGLADSDGFGTAAPGVYRFVATYSGDANFNPVTSPCNAPDESVLVTATAPPSAVVVGAAFYSDGTSVRTGPSGARVSVFATSAEPGFTYRLVSGRTGSAGRPCSADVVPLNDAPRFASGGGVIAQTAGTINRPFGEWQICFLAEGQVVTGAVVYTVTPRAT